MPIYTNNNQGSLNGGFSSFGGFGSLPGFSSGGNADLTPEELIAIAKGSGGAVGQAAEELGHPERSMLSTVGQGFKNIFKGFIDVISLPGEVISGAISKDYTIKEAIQQKKTISDAIFGDGKIDFNGDGNITTMEKVGDFIVRTPFDILLDPTTYLTFGAGASKTLLQKAGLSIATNTSLDVGKEVAQTFGKKIGAGEVVRMSLNDVGQDILNYGRKVTAQAEGRIAAENVISHGLETGEFKKALIDSGVDKTTLDAFEAEAKRLVKKNAADAKLGFLKSNPDLTEKELEALVKSTFESPLKMDLAKKVISNLMTQSPALAKQIVDGGGIKLFGKTLLSAQRIGAVKDLIPGMNLLDEMTLPLRNSLLSAFDPALEKVGGKWIRKPEEYVRVEQGFKDLTQARKVDFGNNMKRIKDVFKLNQSDTEILLNAVKASKIPEDVRLGKAYTELIGIQEKDLAMFEKMGIPKAKLDMYVGNVLLTNNEGKVARNGNFRAVPGTAEHASYAKVIEQSVVPTVHQNPKIAEAIKEVIPEEMEKLSDIRSPQELASALGKQADSIIKKLINSGKTFEEALSDEKVKKLIQARDSVDKLDKNKEAVGKLEAMGFTKDEAGEFAGYWKDNEGRIFNRVAATASEIAEAGFEGFDTNLLTSFVFRGMKNISQLTAHEFMGSLVRDFGKWADEAPPSWVDLSSKAIDDKTSFLGKQLLDGKGQTMKFHPQIAASFDKMMQGLTLGDEVSEGFIKAYDNILRYWKASMTSIFPMFHGRNAISNVFQNFLDLGLQALNPKTHFMAIDMMNKNRTLNTLMKDSLGTGEKALKAQEELNKLLNTTVFTDATGHKWSYGEFNQVVKNNNIAFNQNNLGYMDVADRDKLITSLFEKETKLGKAKSIAKNVNPLSMDNAGFKAGRFVGSGIEDQARLVNFMSNLINTGDVSHAAARTKMFLFDYGNLTKFEKNFMRRVIPFYTWTRKNLELQFKTFANTPGRVISEIKTIKNLGSIFDGEELTDEEQKLVPQWLRNSINLKIKDKDGNSRLLSGFGLPIEQAFQQFTSNQILGSISPLVRFPIEKSTGYQWFRGKPTSEVIDAANYKYAPQALKDFIGYSEYQGTTKEGKKYNVSVALRPERMMTLQNLPFSRVMNTFGNITDKTKTEGVKILENLTGIKTTAFNEELLAQRQQDELRVSLEKMLTDAGIRGEFTRYYNRKNTEQIRDQE